MKDMLIRDDRMSCKAIQESLEHTLTTRNHVNIFLGARLLYSVVPEALF